MDGVQRPSRIVGSPLVQERRGGAGKQDAEAFRRALQEHGDGAAAEREPNPEPQIPEPPIPEPPIPEPPVRRGLQRRGPDGRKGEVTAHHVDVVA